MMLNSEVVAHMYDKDYSGDNQRFAMFGQSIIVEMRVGVQWLSMPKQWWCVVSGWGQVQNCSWQRVSWCSGRKESIHKLSWSSCGKEFALIIYLYHLFFHHYHRYMFSIFTHNKSYNKSKWQGVYNSFLCPLNVCPDQNYHSQLFSPFSLKEKDPVLGLDFYWCHVFPCIFPLEGPLSVFFSSSHACLSTWRECPMTDVL